MKRNLANLLKVKTIITVSLCLALIYGFIEGKIESSDFLIYVSMVFTYYFTKKESDTNDDK